MKVDALAPDFVEYVPGLLEPGILYVSISYETIVHLCCCGCGNKVALPLSPAGWAVTYDGATISVSPSVGNSSLPCRSHYWIRKGRVEWMPAMTHARTAAARTRDRADQAVLERRQDRTRAAGGKGLVGRILRGWRQVIRWIR